MTFLQNPHQSQQWNFRSARCCQSVLLAGALGTASLIATPVLAKNQYCNLASGANCSSNSNLKPRACNRVLKEPGSHDDVLGVSLGDTESLSHLLNHIVGVEANSKLLTG
jgi:hypothetical protein